MQDDYGIYRRPPLISLLALVCAAAALFFGSWSAHLKRQLDRELTAQGEADDTRDRALAHKDRELQEMSGRLRDLQAEIYAVNARLEAASRRLADKPLARATAPAPVEPASAASAASAATAPKIPAEPAVKIALPAATSDDAEVLLQALASAEALTGEILTYNPDYQRVYLSLGAANGGVAPGNRFSIWRGNDYITDVEVQKVFSVTSVCRVLNETTAGLQVGDVARRAKPSVGTL
ncbi:hypothetical protein FACS1894139_10070 [Planctomycetales bacterium]|nr:hypothetical protein FACS1894107_01630 [Planctomycetales bacterium]GHS97251.1 hypothetical protein FACS1894108_03320 [Planctomycetales bacterium]GHT05724.1 hypothetical protein FACS1894139_10070 [Planctomycetales bacterium]